MPGILQQDFNVNGYRVLRLLGKGGMAEVYEVESEKTGALYALKVFACEQANAIFLKKRFGTEARLLARLHHPRIVRVYDYGFVDAEEKIPYYVMDLVLDDSGVPCTLRDAIDRGLSTEERIAAWYGDMVEALDYIHGRGIVHRDVSLENALIGPDGHVVLSDFGVCKILDRDLQAEVKQTLMTMTADGRPLMGKAFYIAPEIRAGQEETPASDLFSLGVLIFYLLNQVWYAPGAKVADMLALFDPQWQTILPALLDSDPQKRHAEPWQDPVVREMAELESRSIRRVRQWQLGTGLAAFLGLLLGLGVIFLRPHPRDPLSLTTTKQWKDARVLCTVPALNLIARQKIEDVRHFVELRTLEALKTEARMPTSPAAEQMQKLAEDISYGPLSLLCRQVAFLLFMRTGNVEQAVEELLTIGVEDKSWRDRLVQSLDSLPDVSEETRLKFHKVWSVQKDAKKSLVPVRTRLSPHNSSVK